METLRMGTFETNSSSCHVMTLMSSSVYGSEWPKNFVVDWKRRGSEYDPGASRILTGEAAVDFMWNLVVARFELRQIKMTFSKEDFAKMVDMLCHDKWDDDIAASFPLVGRYEIEAITDTFRDNYIQSADLRGGIYVVNGDTVGILYEVGC